MTAETTLDLDDDGALIALATPDPVAVLTDPARFDAFLAKVKEVAATAPTDVSTDKNRKAIASIAYRIAKAKTALDAEGKGLKEEALAHINKVDAARRRIRESLDALKDEVRRPLTEWEAAESAREEAVADAMQRLRQGGYVDIEDTAANVEARIAAIEAVEIDSAIFQTQADAAERLKAATLETLRAAKIRLEQHESERAELDRLRRDAEERALQEQARIEEEARARAEAERAARAEAETAERERRAAEEAADRARHQAEAESAEKVRAAEAEATRLREEAARRDQEQRRSAAEAASRAADEAHRARVIQAIEDAVVVEAGLRPEAAADVAAALAAGRVPHVTIQF